MTGPDTRTTQIYICKTDMTSQDKDGFAPLGTVILGMDVVDRLYAGYGESAGGGMRGGKQGAIFAGGNAHLDRNFPKLEKLVRVRLVP
jgi:homoserine O-acetyltransferase